MMPPMVVVRDREANRARAMAVWGEVAVNVHVGTAPVKALRATQLSVCPERVATLGDAEELPRILVARIGRRYVIVDGHHRATLAVQRGETYIEAIVVCEASTPKRSTGG